MTKETNPVVFVEFEDNQALSTLVGPQDSNILRLEQRLGVSIALRGNKIAISGPEPEITYAKTALQYLYSQFFYNTIIYFIDTKKEQQLKSVKYMFFIS